MSAWGAASLRSCDSLLDRLERELKKKDDDAVIEVHVLPTKQFGSAQVHSLAQILLKQEHQRNNKRPKVVLRASGHALPVEDVRALGEACRRTGLVRSLAIGDSSMADEGIAALCQGLLNGEQRPLSPEKQRKTLSFLEELDLSDKGMSGAGLVAVWPLFPLLRTLNISRNPSLGAKPDDSDGSVESKEWWTMLHRHASPLSGWQLQELDLSACDLQGYNSRLGAALAPVLLQVESLWLSNNPLGGQAGQRWPDSWFSFSDVSDVQKEQKVSSAKHDVQPNWKRLYLDGCNLSQSNLDLTWLPPTLVVLDLSRNGLGPTQTWAGASWTHNLRELYLTGNPLGPQGVASVLGKLKGQSLRVLELGETDCGAVGAQMAVQFNASRLHLCRNNLGADGFRSLTSLAVAMHQRRYLDLANNGADSEAVVAVLAALGTDETLSSVPKLETIVVGGNGGGSAALEQQIQTLRSRHPLVDVARDRLASHANPERLS